MLSREAKTFSAMPEAARVLSPETSIAPRPLRAGDHVFLVDGSSYVFRAYFAMF